MKVIMLKTKE